MQQHLPNFFLAGVPKTGTTSLYHYLRQHPDIYMSPLKEPTFFTQEARLENYAAEEQERMSRQSLQLHKNLQTGVLDDLYRGVVTRWEDYLKLFEDVKGERAVGEASLSYLWSRTAAKEIAAVMPNAKILLILRHPAERAFSEYLHQVSDGHVSHSFERHLRIAMQSDRKLSAYYPFLEFGEYAEQLERLFSYFPREQVRIWIYEDTLQEPHQFRKQVFQFLGVDQEFIPDTRKRYYQMEIPRVLTVSQTLRRSGIWRGMRRMVPIRLLPAAKRMMYHRHGALKLGKSERAFLVEHYREGVKNLECLLDRDLSGWLQ